MIKFVKFVCDRKFLSLMSHFTNLIDSSCVTWKNFPFYHSASNSLQEANNFSWFLYFYKCPNFEFVTEKTSVFFWLLFYPKNNSEMILYHWYKILIRLATVHHDASKSNRYNSQLAINQKKNFSCKRRFSRRILALKNWVFLECHGSDSISVALIPSQF